MVAIKPIQPAAGPTGHAELVAEPLKPVSGPAATERALEKPHLCTADPGAVAAIVGAYHSTPFDILGIHPHAVDGKPAIVIRTFQPQAFAVSVVHGDQAYPMHRVHRDGFFEVVIQNQTEFFPYRLAITTFASDGGPQQTYEIEDPYRYPPILTDFDLHLIGEGSHYRLYEKLGARVIEHAGAKGVSFSVWAPNAERVSVVGNFNQWDGRCHPMRPRGASGVWEIFVPGLQQGDLYKFEVKSRYHGYLAVKSDPFAHLSEMRPNTSSVVWDLNRYEWHDQEWMATRKQRQRLDAPIAIYEVHPGSWKRKDDAIGMRWLSYREMAEDLVPYVREMGYTHIELLPITEHPFDGSWGYQSIGYFASTSRYGSPDDFRYFVDKAHQAGLGVILDWAGGHFPKDGYGLSYFDGTCLYEHEDPRKGEHQDWGTLIYNFGRNEVRAFLLSSAVFWLDKYHIDGLRVDAVASMLYLDYSRQPGEWIANEFGGHENLEAVAFIKQFNEVIHLEYPDVLTFAEESTAWPQVSRPTYLGGLGFDLKWNMGWMHDMLEYMSKDPIHRRYHHNNLTFSLLYAFTENFVLPFSHDEVTHGKGAMLSKMPGDYWQKFANLRALYGYMYAHPGKKLLFMGGEIGQWSEWNHDWQLDWSLLDHDLHRKIQEYLRALNKLYVEQPALHEVDFSWEGFQWIDFHDVDNGVVSFVRRAKEPNDFVLAVANFTPVPREGYRVGVPAPGFYRELLNSDSTYYGGSNMGNTGGVPSEPLPWQGQQHSILLTVPPLAVVFLKPDKEAPSSEMSNAATTPIRANRNNAQHQEHPAETLKLNDEQGNSDE